MAKKIGYEVSLYVIAGLPGSSLESEKRTLELTKKCVPTMTKVSFCHPYPGSPLWELVKDQLRGVSWDRYSETNMQNPIYTSNGLNKDKIQFWMNALDDKS
jgi:radical SAM superfamily enzyme YgiQ (UPF0313 family)